MMHGILIAAMLTLVGDSGVGEVPAPPQPASHPAQVSMNAADWTLKYSPTLDRIQSDWILKHGDQVYTAVPMDRRKARAGRLLSHRPTSLGTRLSHPSPDPQGGWSLSLGSLFPGKTFPLAYLITTASPILTQGHYVKMVGEISALGEIAVPPGLPVWCRMYIREVDDDPSYSKTYHQNYRWWSTDAMLLQRRRLVLVVGLEPQFWTNVAGVPGDLSGYATAGFQGALANPQTIGIMCQGNYVANDYYVGRIALFHPTLSITSFAVCDPSQGGATSDFADAPSAKQEDEVCAPPHQ